MQSSQTAPRAPVRRISVLGLLLAVLVGVGVVAGGDAVDAVGLVTVLLVVLGDVYVVVESTGGSQVPVITKNS